MAKLLSRAIFVMLLALILLTAIPYGTVDPWWEAAFECFIFALGILWMIESLVSGEWRLCGAKFHAPLLLLVAFAYVQTLPLMGVESAGLPGSSQLSISADPYQTWRFMWRLLALMLAGELLLRYTTNEKRLGMLIHTIIGVAVASAVFGIVRQATQGDTAGFLLPQLMPKHGYAQFINRNHFAFLAEMALGLVSGLIMGNFVKRDRVLLYLAAAVPMWAAVALSISRGGILGLFSQFLFLAPLFRRAQSRHSSEGKVSGKRFNIGIRVLVARGALITCLALTLIVSVIWVGGDQLVDHFETLSGDTNAVVEAYDTRPNVTRTDIWGATLDLIKDKPVAGVGFGGYWAAISRYHDASGTLAPQQAHNEYLEVLASGGIIAFALVAWFVAALIMSARENLRARGTFRRASCLGALSGLFAVAVHSFVDFGLHATANAYVFTALVVIAARKLPCEHSKRRESLP